MEPLIQILPFVVAVCFIAFSAFVTACLSNFLFQNMKEGKIFYFWRSFIDWKFAGTWLHKPLGGCVFCMNVWVGFFILASYTPFIWPYWTTLVGWQMALSAIYTVVVHKSLADYFLRKMDLTNAHSNYFNS